MIWATSILSIGVICLVIVSILDYFQNRDIKHRLDKLDGASLNNMRREKNMNHDDLLK